LKGTHVSGDVRQLRHTINVAAASYLLRRYSDLFFGGSRMPPCILIVG